MRTKLTVFLIIALSLILFLSSLILYNYFKQNTFEAFELKLASWADDIVLDIIKNPESFMKNPKNFISYPRENVYVSSGMLVQYDDENGKAVSKSDTLKDETLPFVKNGDEVMSDVEISDGTKLKVYQKEIDIEGKKLGYLIAGTRSSYLYRNLDNLREALIVVMLCTVLIAGFVIVFIFYYGILENQKKFLAFASHELRTPLSVISGTAEVALRNKDLGDEEVLALEEIRGQSDLMASLVSNYMYIFKSSGGKERINKKTFDISELITEEAGRIKKRYPKKNIVLNYEDVFEICADSGQLSKAVRNLLDNAAKYTAQNGTIEISLKSDKGKLFIAVKDNGPGIDRKFQKKIFDIYYRIEKNDKKGVGIGLAVAKWVVEAHKGKISVQSEKGNGSTFTIELPM